MINKAMSFVVLAHQGQKRKGTNIPYAFHPLEVGYILSQVTEDQEVICAGLLHDTVEDVKMDLKTIEVMFSERTAELVAAQSEDKSKSWEERKQHTIDCFQTASLEETIICCADKLSNIRSIDRDYKKLGDNLWGRFNKGYESQKWYYKNLVNSLERLCDNEKYSDIYEEFKETVIRVFEYKLE